jgi:tetratricopeptide (TPR) repeat protein
MIRTFFRKFDQHPSLTLVVLFILIILYYIPTFSNDFTNWDDAVNITGNPYITSFTFFNVKSWFTLPLLGMYSPVVYFSYAIDYAAGGLNPFTFHLTNLILHVLNVYLILLIIVQITNKRSHGIFLALIFSIHPLIISGVTPLSVRSNLLFTLFLLLAMRFYFKYLLNGNKALYLYLTLFFFLLSVLSKSAAVIFSFVLFASDYLFERKVSWKMFSEKLPFFAVSIFTGLLSLHFRNDAGLSFNDYNFFDRVFLSFYSLSYYSFKWIFPFQFSPLYDYPLKNNGFLPAIYYISLIWLVLSGILIYYFRKNRIFIFGIMFYILNLLLVIKIIPVGMEFVSDRYAYISSIGLLISISGILLQLKQTHFDKFLIPLLTLFVFCLLWFYLSDNQRQSEWKDSKTLWSAVIEKQPNMTLAWINMGVLLNDENKPKEAILYFDKSIKLKANIPEGFFNRANAYKKLNNPEKALADYNLCLDADRNYYKAYLNRGILYYELKDFYSAIRDVNKAISLHPNYTEGFYNRAVIKYELQDYKGAISDFSKSIQLNPNDYKSFMNRGSVYLMVDSLKQAFSDLTIAINIFPEYGLAYENRARTAVKMNMADQACRDLTEAIRYGQKPDQELIRICCNKLP